MKKVSALIFAIALYSCGSDSQEKNTEVKLLQLDPIEAAKEAQKIEGEVFPELAEGLNLKLWAIDTLADDPIAIHVDNQGRLYMTRTNRQNNSEFDVRDHIDWETPSQSFQTVEDRRAFLREELSTENGPKNPWLNDVNGDGHNDWRDLTVETNQLFRLEDTNGDDIADKSILVTEGYNDEISDVSGAIHVTDDDIFFGVGPDMWRLKDKDDDGVAEERESLVHGFNVHIGLSGHGMSGATMGPDGRIYWGIGDPGFNGTDKSGKHWEYPNRGVIARCNPDGTDFEIYAMGVRNTHEFVFDEYANLISVDNDGDHRGEEERLVYLTNGSDSGWRINWQFGKYRDPKNNTYKVWMDEEYFKPRFDGQAAFITPCIKNYVSGPTGMAYNPGTALNEDYNNTFFIVEFVGNPSRSGIHAFKLKPKGATFDFDGDHKALGEFLPTGLSWGPDGSLYMGDWVTGWKTKDYGRIWKMDADNKNPLREETQSYLESDFSALDPVELQTLLGHADMRVRRKAQFELVKRGQDAVAIFESTLASQENQLARIHAIIGLTQLERKGISGASGIMTFLTDEDPEIRAQSAKWLGDIRFMPSADNLLPLLKDESERVQFFAAEALGRMAYKPAVNEIIEMLRANDDVDAYLRHAGSLALSRIGEVQPITALATDNSKALRMAAVIALRRMENKGIALFLNDKEEHIVTEAARGINDDFSIEGALADLGNILNTTSFTNEPLIRRSINANVRTGSDMALKNLIAFASNTAHSGVMRAEAAAAIGVWDSPSVFDRVDGKYRGVITRPKDQVLSLASSLMTNLLEDINADVKVAAAVAIGRLGIKSAGTKLYDILANGKDQNLRVEAFNTLSVLEDSRIPDAISLALKDDDKLLRTAGLEKVPSLNISDDLKVSLLSDVVAGESPQAQQTALLELGKLNAGMTGAVFNKYLEDLESGDFPSSLLLELEEAIDSSHSGDLASKFKEIKSKLYGDDIAVNYDDCLEGGNADRGRRILYAEPAAQCMKCHSVGDYGGDAGPQLSGVGDRLTKPQMLESLINPSAVIAPGFGFVTVDLKDGSAFGGTLIEENDETIVLKTNDDPEKLILKADIAERINSASSMLPMGKILSKKQIRDVIAALSELKEG